MSWWPWWIAAVALAVAVAGACSSESDGEHCPSPTNPIALSYDADDARVVTSVDCAGDLREVCENANGWHTNVHEACERTRIEISRENFAVPHCIYLFVDDGSSDTKTIAQLVLQDDVGDGPDEILEPDGGWVELTAWNSEEVAGQFELDFGGGDGLRGTFAWAP